MMSFGERVKRARELAGMSQAEAAEEIGMSRVCYNRWESLGAIPKTLDKYKLAAAAFGVSWQWLADGVGPMRARKRRAA